jgi:hypothetical protein
VHKFVSNEHLLVHKFVSNVCGHVDSSLMAGCTKCVSHLWMYKFVSDLRIIEFVSDMCMYKLVFDACLRDHANVHIYRYLQCAE